LQQENHFAALKKEVLEIRDRNPALSPDNAFVAWYLRAFIVDDESSAIAALKGGSRDKGLVLLCYKRRAPQKGQPGSCPRM
jgi:hypothetical protein